MLERQPSSPAVTRLARPRILVTGGNGQIGALVAANLGTRYDLVLLDRRPPADATWPYVCADISQADAYLDIALTARDLLAMLAACIAAPEQLRFGIYHAVSQRRSRRFDLLPGAAELGFVPQDDARTLAWRNPRGMLRRVRARLRRRNTRRLILPARSRH